MRYELGHVIDSEDYSLNANDDITKNKIKVFTEKGEAKYIDAGATMLDFAFLIHSDLGLQFDYALVDDTKTYHKAYEKLTPGDTIKIETKEEIRPKIQWFKYAKTTKAVEELIHYFASNCP